MAAWKFEGGQYRLQTPVYQTPAIARHFEADLRWRQTGQNQPLALRFLRPATAAA